MHDHGIVQQLEALLAEAGPAHHQAFAATDGEDPEWAGWYAVYVQGRLNGLLGTSLTVEEIAGLLTAAEKERAKHNPDAEWTHYYAEYLLEPYA